MQALWLRLLISFLLLCTPSSSDAQGDLLTGVVTDSRGNALQGAVVQLENAVTLSVRSYITDADGRYHFSGVNSEMDHTLKARYRKFWSKPRLLTRFDSIKHDIRLVIPIE